MSLPASAPGRIAFFDNARGLLIGLVVLGHTLEAFRFHFDPDAALFIAYKWIYLFHIPAFALAAGFFASDRLDSKLLRSTALRCALPYCIFQLVYTFAHNQLSGAWPRSYSLLSPYWVLWFLVSLAGWRLALPAVLRLPHPLAWAFAGGLAIGYWVDDGRTLSVSRTLVFFPFFVLGYQLREEHFVRLRAAGWRAVAVIVLIGAAWAVSELGPLLKPPLLHGRVGYARLGYDGLFAMLPRLASYLTALVVGAALFAWVPRQRTFLATWGERSLYVFILHGLAVRLLGWWGWLETGWSQSAQSVLLLFVAVGLTAVLASEPVRRLTRPLIEPEWMWQRLRQS